MRLHPARRYVLRRLVERDERAADLRLSMRYVLRARATMVLIALVNFSVLFWVLTRYGWLSGELALVVLAWLTGAAATMIGNSRANVLRWLALRRYINWGAVRSDAWRLTASSVEPKK